MHPRDAQPHAEREPVAWREQALALFAKIYNVIDNEDNFEPLDEAIACAKEGIALLSTASPADEMQALRAAAAHALNEWADLGSNANQWLRNIRDGISTADEALQEMQTNYDRVLTLSRSALKGEPRCR